MVSDFAFISPSPGETTSACLVPIHLHTDWQLLLSQNGRAGWEVVLSDCAANRKAWCVFESWIMRAEELWKPPWLCFHLADVGNETGIAKKKTFSFFKKTAVTDKKVYNKKALIWGWRVKEYLNKKSCRNLMAVVPGSQSGCSECGLWGYVQRLGGSSGAPPAGDALPFQSEQHPNWRDRKAVSSWRSVLLSATQKYFFRATLLI